MKNGQIPVRPIRQFRISGFLFPVLHSFFDSPLGESQGEGRQAQTRESALSILRLCPLSLCPLTSRRRAAKHFPVRAAGWSSSVARRAHNPKVGGSNPPPATSP
jgi:hypothetical protein